MNKQITVTRNQVQEYIHRLNTSAKATCDRLKHLLNESREPLDIFQSMRFQQIGCDPLDAGRLLNLTEQLNQTLTYLASFEGARRLFERHPNIGVFTLNLGTASGSDIQTDEDGGIAAEVFAAVDPNNNGKLKKDAAKVRAVKGIEHRYVLYISPKHRDHSENGIEVIHLNNPL